MDIVLGDDSTEVTTIFLLMKRAKLVKEPASAKALHIYCQNLGFQRGMITCIVIVNWYKIMSRSKTSITKNDNYYD